MAISWKNIKNILKKNYNINAFIDMKKLRLTVLINILNV